MILTCPNCSTRFLVDNAALGETGRRVRCRSCGHTWFQEPPQREPVQPPEESAPAQEEPEAAAQTAAPEAGGTQGRARQRRPATPSAPQSGRSPRERARILLIWMLLLLVIGGTAGAAVNFREPIVEAWPPAARLYAMVGLEMPALGEGLAIQDTASFRESRAGEEALVVEGLIRNTSNTIKDIPALRVSLLDAQRRRLNWVTLQADDQRLLPGETTTFDARVRNPHSAATTLSVTFTRDEAGWQYHPDFEEPQPVPGADPSPEEQPGDADGTVEEGTGAAPEDLQ